MISGEVLVFVDVGAVAELVVIIVLVGLICAVPVWAVYRELTAERRINNFLVRLAKESKDKELVMFNEERKAAKKILREIKRGRLPSALMALQEKQFENRAFLAYDLACAYALLGDLTKCRELLELGSSVKSLPSLDTAVSERGFERICGEDWFRGLNWHEPEAVL